MKLFSQRDCQHWEDASTLQRLGQHRKASQALARISPRRQTHPDVLELRLELLIKAKRWQVCADAAATLLALYPENPLGWIHRAVALRHLQRPQEAFDLLSPAIARFSGLWLVPFILAACSLQLNRPAVAKHWLQQALALDPEMVRLEVQEETQLRPLLKALRQSAKAARLRPA